MGLITLNLKRVLNWNFIFMSAVAAIFGMISLMNFGDISENIVFGVDIKYFMLDGYLCLFIFFAGEISKDMLQQEKITKRIEWKLANGIKISSVLPAEDFCPIITRMVCVPTVMKRCRREDITATTDIMDTVTLRIIN